MKRIRLHPNKPNPADPVFTQLLLDVQLGKPATFVGDRCFPSIPPTIWHSIVVVAARIPTTLALRQTGSVATAIISPAKNALTQKNARISSALVMVSPSSNWRTRRWREGGALAIIWR
jgi:hypothetical protein